MSQQTTLTACLVLGLSVGALTNQFTANGFEFNLLYLASGVLVPGTFMDYFILTHGICYGQFMSSTEVQYQINTQGLITQSTPSRFLPGEVAPSLGLLHTLFTRALNYFYKLIYLHLCAVDI